jgi:hypothetical protein
MTFLRANGNVANGIFFTFSQRGVNMTDRHDESPNLSDAEPQGDRPTTESLESDYSEYGDGKVFTQRDVNRIVQDRIAKERTRRGKELADLERQHEHLLTQHNLSEAQREQLQASLDDVVHQREEVAASERKQLEERHKKELTKARTSAEQWETRYKSSLIDNALTAAAAQHGAFNAGQLAAMLKSNTKVIADGNGNMVPVVSFQDEDGSVDLPVGEAVARMKGRPDQYGNLFKSTAVSGIGGNSNVGGVQPGSTGAITPQQAARLSPKEYMKARAQGRLPWLAK